MFFFFELSFDGPGNNISVISREREREKKVRIDMRNPIDPDKALFQPKSIDIFLILHKNIIMLLVLIRSISNEYQQGFEEKLENSHLYTPLIWNYRKP